MHEEEKREEAADETTQGTTAGSSEGATAEAPKPCGVPTETGDDGQEPADEEDTDLTSGGSEPAGE